MTLIVACFARPHLLAQRYRNASSDQGSRADTISYTKLICSASLCEQVIALPPVSDAALEQIRALGAEPVSVDALKYPFSQFKFEVGINKQSVASIRAAYTRS